MQRFFIFFFGVWFMVYLGQSADKPAPAKTSTPKETAKFETELMAQFKAFAIRKREYAKKIAKEKKLTPLLPVSRFFKEAIAGDFVAAEKQFKTISKIYGRSYEEQFHAPKKMREAVQALWAPILEVLGAMEAVDGWHSKFLILYMRDIVGSIPKGSIYFGGTDPGRFAITLGSNSHEKADPFFTITQNAFADGIYLQYLRELYGKRIYIPTVKDNQDAFTEYIQNAQKRMITGGLAPGENVTLKYNFKCPQCDTPQLISINQSRLEIYKKITTQGGLRCPTDNTLMPTPAPQAQVRGNGAVMAINALLAKKIFDKNPEHEFYLEESFPLPWMMPHMVPHGLIFKLERKPLKELHQDHIAQSRKDWQKYMALCVGDAVVKPETTVAELCKWVETIYIKGNHDNFKGDALFLKGKKEVMEKPEFRKGPPFSEQKAFSKMRCGQAQLFSWRQTTTKGAELKKVYAQEADFAFRQAFALGPINPEVAVRYVHYLNSNHRFDDAKLIAQTFGKTSPDQKDMSRRLILQSLTIEESQLVAKGDYVKAAEVALEMAQLDAKNPGHMTRHQYYQQMILQNRRFISAFKNAPGNTTNFLRVVQLYTGMRKTNEVVQAIELFSQKSKKNRINLTATKNAYGLIGDWKNKLKVDLELTKHAPDSYAAWFDLAQTHMRLKQTNESTQAMLKALVLFEKAKIKTPDIIPILRTNALFKPLRARPEIKKILRDN